MRFPSKDATDHSGSSKEDLTSLLQDCRLLRKDELMVVKGSSAPKLPECFQRVPKKITVTENGQILAVTIDNEGKVIFYEH